MEEKFEKEILTENKESTQLNSPRELIERSAILIPDQKNIIYSLIERLEQSYENEKSKKSVLTREEEYALFKGYTDLKEPSDTNEDTEQCSKILKDIIVEFNIPLVINITKSIIKRTRSEKGLSSLPQSTEAMLLQDYISEGTLGLLEAIEKFDYRLGNKFSTFATWEIRKYIYRALGNYSSAIRIPLSRRDDIVRYHRTNNSLKAKLGRDPTNKEVAKEMDLSEHVVEIILGAINVNTTVSLNLVINEEEDSELGELLEGESHNPESKIDCDMEMERIEEAMRKCLTTREEYIIRSIYIQKDNSKLSLQKIGNQYALTRERIRQIRNVALRKLRNYYIIMGYKKTDMDS